MSKEVDFEDVFGPIEDEDWEVLLYDILDGEHEGTTSISNDLSYNSGWYNHYEVKFDYKGKRYAMEYKDHVSDNVSDREYGDLMCLGNVDEIEETITREELNNIVNGYEKRLQSSIESNKELRKYKKALNNVRFLSHKDMKFLEEMFVAADGERELTNMEVNVSKFFGELADMRQQGDF